MIARHGLRSQYPDWGRGSSASNAVTVAEDPIECMVSEHIGKMPFLWLAVDDREMRGWIERNSIALLSNYERDDTDQIKGNRAE